ncbi:hypothetical protein BDD12DRAFT_824919, partial [Trichophaea hybrida]
LSIDGIAFSIGKSSVLFLLCHFLFPVQFCLLKSYDEYRVVGSLSFFWGCYGSSHFRFSFVEVL